MLTNTAVFDPETVSLLTAVLGLHPVLPDGVFNGRAFLAEMTFTL